MAATPRRSSVSKAAEAARYYYEPNEAKSKTGVSVSNVTTKSKHRRSASTSQTKLLDDKDRIKNGDKKHGRRSSSLLDAIFGPSIPTAPPCTRKCECLTCGSDDVPVTRSAKLKCGHRMCNSCLRRVFNMSLKDASHMAPRCCNSAPIPLKHVDHLFDDKFKVLWNAKYQEYTTKNRLYCPAKGWQRCYSCKAMVQLNEGCNHMTCRCGSEFCMLCAEPWKTCKCPIFNPAVLLDHDRLNHMRVPETLVATPSRSHPCHRNEPSQRPRNEHPNPPLTYQQELNAPRRQERADEALARRLSAATITNPPAPARRPRRDTTTECPRRDTATEEVFGSHGHHFLNDNYISNTSRINATVIGDPTLARRGERESGRRSRRQSTTLFDSGLVLDAFGTESVLGLAPPPAPAQPPARRPSLRQRLGSISNQNGHERIGAWLNRLG